MAVTPLESLMRMRQNHPTSKSVEIWDIPLRLFHWLLMVSVIASIGSVKAGNMFVHEKAGISVAALLIFRVIWGFAGNRHARFAHFLTGPGRVIAYIKSRMGGERGIHPGHAPTGGWATMVILMVFAGMASMGLMAHDDVLYEGPLAAWAGDFTDTATRLHHLGEKLVFAVIAMHLLAMLIYRFWLKINLVPAMLHGGRDEVRQPSSKTRQIAGVMVLAAVLITAHALGMSGERFY